jgi:hypothetical protein
VFTVLICTNLGLSAAISLLAYLAFRHPLKLLIQKRFGEEASLIWARYILFLVGTMSVVIGTRIWDIERYATDKNNLVISGDLLVLELYRTAIATLACNATFSLVVLIIIWMASLARRKV